MRWPTCAKSERHEKRQGESQRGVQAAFSASAVAWLRRSLCRWRSGRCPAQGVDVVADEGHVELAAGLVRRTP